MRRATLTLLLFMAVGASTKASGPRSSIQSVPRGTRSFYGTNFGNRYQYFGLGYGYTPGAFGPGGWAAYGGGGYGGRRGYGGYSGSGGSRYGGYGNYDMQQQQLHQQQMMWTMNFAPMPQTTPGVTVNPYWNPYQSRLSDDIYRRSERPPEPATFENPFARHPAQ